MVDQNMPRNPNQCLRHRADITHDHFETQLNVDHDDCSSNLLRSHNHSQFSRYANITNIRLYLQASTYSHHHFSTSQNTHFPSFTTTTQTPQKCQELPMSAKALSTRQVTSAPTLPRTQTTWTTSPRSSLLETLPTSTTRTTLVR